VDVYASLIAEVLSLSWLGLVGFKSQGLMLGSVLLLVRVGMTLPQYGYS